jgi:hypothetical protein
VADIADNFMQLFTDEMVCNSEDAKKLFDLPQFRDWSEIADFCSTNF